MATLGLFVDTRDFRKLHDHLERVRSRALPYAARDALNGCAFELRKEWQEKIRGTFTNRNAFTVRSIRVEKATTLDMRAMQSRTGSVAPYMGDQEEGGEVKGKGKHKAIPSPLAGGGRPGGGKRPRMVSSRFRLSSVNIPQHKVPKYGKRRQNAVLLAIAIRKGERFALLNRMKGKGRGIFEVKGLKRKAKTRLIWNVSKGSVHVKPSETMRLSTLSAGHRFERVIYQSLLRQLQRNKLMGF
jgi:hypothetical protein